MEPLGRLALPTGTIVAWDPLGLRYRLAPWAPYRRTVAPGTYELVAAKVGDRVAFTRLEIMAGAIASWQVARYDEGTGDSYRVVDGTGYHDGAPTFSCDSGVAVFLDHATATSHLEWREARDRAVYERVQKDPALAKNWNDSVRDGLASAPIDPMDTLVKEPRRLDLPRGGNAIATKTGNTAGQPWCSSFFGLDASGAAVCLLTSFRVIVLRDPLAHGRATLEAWERAKLIEVKRHARRDEMAVALGQKLEDDTSGLAEWLFDRPEILDVHGSDEQLAKLAH